MTRKKLARALLITMGAAVLSFNAVLPADAFYGGMQQEVDAGAFASDIPETSDAIEYGGGTIAIYDLRDSRNYGSAMAEASTGTRIDFEGYYGIRLAVEDDKVSYSVYTHTAAAGDSAKITLYEVNSWTEKGEADMTKVRSLGTLKKDTERRLAAKLADGLYAIGAVFDVNGSDNGNTVYGYLYVDGGEVRTCRIVHVAKDCFGNFARDIDAWNYVLGDEDPEDYLSNKGLTYPTSGTGNNCVHVKDWEAISDEIVLSDDWTDEAKVFAFVEYLAKNIAFDEYKKNVLITITRAKEAGTYSDDQYFALVNHVGVCWDYTNILAIMCRHHGIPCTSVENSQGTHTFNAVWLNDGWVGIDLTQLNRWVCTTKDTDQANWKPSGAITYSCYGAYDIIGGMERATVDTQIWTRERGLGIQ